MCPSYLINKIDVNISSYLYLAETSTMISRFQGSVTGHLEWIAVLVRTD